MIDSTKYETPCTPSVKHGIRGALSPTEMNGPQDNPGKLGMC